jgi:glycosyltransferase involved in cell wall biosynthesis
LAAAFAYGLEKAVELGADVIVNTDADNQYNAECVAELVAPVVAGNADIVLGARPIESIEHFSWLKKKLQRLGSWVVSRAAGLELSDVTSGFRAYTREAAMQLTVISGYTYTLETIIQAGRSGMTVREVPIQVGPQTRPSRLMRSIPHYLMRSLDTILRIYTLYSPLRFFSTLGVIALTAGMLIGLRFLYFYLFVPASSGGHIQSLILCAILILLAVQFVVMGFLADLIAANRKLLQDIRAQVRAVRHGRK